MPRLSSVCMGLELRSESTEGTRMFEKDKRLAGAIKVISYLLILLPAALGFLFIYLFGVNVVVRDSWWIVPLFDKLFSGTLGFSDLFAQNNEHRILFPRIAMLLLGTLTKYNNVAEMYLVQSCFLTTLICFLFAFRESIRSKLSLLVPISFLPISFLVFSLRQDQNMLLGFQVTFAFVQMFSVLAFCFLYVSGRKRFRRIAFPAALGSGTVATFSAAQGLFVWPVGLLQLLISPIEKTAKKWLLGAWSLVGVGEWTVYFIGYVSPPHGSTPRYVLEHPVAGIELFLALLGNSLFDSLLGPPSFALASGVGVLLAGFVAASLLLIYKDRKWGENSFWIALLFFSLLILVSITVGRPELGTSQATPSKYATFAILTVISTYAMLAKVAIEKKSRVTTCLLCGLCMLILLSVPISYKQGVAVGVRKEAENEEAAFILATYESQPDERLETTFSRDPEAIRNGASILENLDYNVFSKPRP